MPFQFVNKEEPISHLSFYIPSIEYKGTVTHAKLAFASRSLLCEQRGKNTFASGNKSNSHLCGVQLW